MPPGPIVDFIVGPFVPRYSPEVRVTKARNLQSQQDLCEGEYMYDLGGKNREIHVTGYVHVRDFPTFNGMLEAGEPMEMVSEKWTGEVLVKRGRLEGAYMWDGYEDDWLSNFSLDLVSTGRDERGETNYGIIGGSGGGGAAPSTSGATPTR